MVPTPTPVDEREIFTSGPVVVFKWRNAPGWPVEYCSRNVLDLFGYTVEAFRSGEVAYSDLVHPDDLPRVGAEVQAATESTVDSFTHKPYRIRRRDGRELWLHDHTHVIRDGTGAATHYHGYVFDITGRVEAEAVNRRLQEQLLQTQKLESLGVLAGGLAHDFNNALTGIQGHANLARRALEGGAPEARASALESIAQIEALSTQVAALCHQLLAYSGRGRFLVVPLDLARLIQDVTSMVRVAISKKALLELELEHAVAPVRGDKAQIQQVLLNLVTNASEALGDDPGTIRIGLGWTTLEKGELGGLVPGAPLEPGRYVRLAVEDTGCGMARETVDRLFDPFFTTKFTGRGLGLAAALGIARGHGAGIRVRSVEGQGSRFELLFPPCAEQPVATPAPAPVSAFVPRGGLVLLADDEPIVRRVGQRMLEELGYRVELAKDGLEAIQRLRAEPADGFEFALLDLTMPALGGLEALRELRDTHPTLPVILSSGFTDAALDRLDDERVVFLPKPFSFEELSQTIRRLPARDVEP